MLHFILGRVKSGKTTYLVEKISGKRDAEVLFVVPEQLSHSAERFMCEKCGNSISATAEVTNFRRLATGIKSELGGISATVVGSGKRILYLHRVAVEVAKSLKTLTHAAARPGYLDKLCATIDEFKAYGISPERLSACTSELKEELADKISDLSLIYAAYEAKLSEDEYDAYDELAYSAEISKKGGFFKGKTVCFDGFSGFNAAELDTIAAAISDADEVYISLTLPEDFIQGEENGIFDKCAETKKRIEQIAKKKGVEHDETYLCHEGKGALAHLDKALFSETVLKFDGNGQEIKISKAGTVFEECELAAAYILDNVREKGLRFRDFSIAVTDSAEYIRECERVFSRYGIPAYSGVKRDLISHPAVALVLAALDCIIRRFKTEAVLSYLKTGFTGIRAKSLDIFENYIYTWSPKPSEWSKGCEFEKNPFGLTAEETDESREILRIVNCVRRKIYEPINHLKEAIAENPTGEGAAKALFDFINEIELPRRMNAYSYLCSSSGRLADAQEYEMALGLLYNAINSIGICLDDVEINAESLAELFEIIISHYDLATIPASLDCVKISELSRADGEETEIRLILGACEGNFPKTEGDGGLLSDDEREELSGYGIELSPGLSERALEGYRTIHSVMCSPRRALYISSATSAARGEVREEATIVSRLRLIYGDVENKMLPSEARLRAKIPCFDESVANGTAEKLWKDDPEYLGKLVLAAKNAEGKRGPIKDRKNIEKIFGKKIPLSASRADLYSSCRYAYFLRYGLKVSRREPAEISPIEAGTLLHYVLENVFRQLSKEENYDVEKAETLALEFCREYVERAMHGKKNLSGRMEFILHRLERTVRKAVSDICREMQKSKFHISEFELKFTGGGDSLAPLEIKGENATVAFRGAIDRVDMYESDNKLYFRVVDYKTGKKSFSLDEAVNGIGMQMLLYMFALEEIGKERYGKELSPAGVMYVTLSPEMNKERGKQESKKREGVILNDVEIIDAMEEGEEKEYLPVSIDKKGNISKKSAVLSKVQFDIIKDHIKKLLADIGDEISRGEIEPNPYETSDSDACRWCEYKSICAFDEVRTSDSKRALFACRASKITNEEGEDENE